MSQQPVSLKIFQITECDWWAGYDAESVRAAYRQTVGSDEADAHFAEFGEAKELPESKLDSFVVIDVDEPGHPKHTAREILAEILASKQEIPCAIASTEY